MPLISSFFGILIYMYWLDTKQHHSPMYMPNMPVAKRCFR